MALVIALALMTGLQQELRDRILGSNPHIYVWKTQRHRRLPRRGRQAAARCRTCSARRRRFSARALMSAARDAAVRQIKGIDPALEPQVTDLKRARSPAAASSALDTPDGEAAGGDPARQGSRRASSASTIGDSVSC